jgi:hypothetical protein
MDRDPQLAQMLNNPELMRESLNMMSNPVSVWCASCCAACWVAQLSDCTVLTVGLLAHTRWAET